jgi:hypothetical protein
MHTSEGIFATQPLGTEVPALSSGFLYKVTAKRLGSGPGQEFEDPGRSQGLLPKGEKAPSGK